jgi:hypothetical protein
MLCNIQAKTSNQLYISAFQYKLDVKLKTQENGRKSLSSISIIQKWDHSSPLLLCTSLCFATLQSTFYQALQVALRNATTQVLQVLIKVER